MFRILRGLKPLLFCLATAALILILPGVSFAQVTAPKVDNVPIPANVDVFNLSFEDFKKYSSAKNFELLGQSYFKVPQRTDWAKAIGRPGPEVGSGFNTVRVRDEHDITGAHTQPNAARRRRRRGGDHSL